MDVPARTSGWPTVPHVLRRSARLWGSREAVVDGDRRLDFADLCSRSLRLAGGLRALGLDGRDRVAFIGHNSLEYLECYFAVPAGGMVLLPLNWRLAPDEVSYILQDAGCRAVVVGEGFAGVVEEATTDLDVRCIAVGDGVIPRGWRQYESLQREGSAAASDARPSDVAYLYYTSGTTGRPKGCMLTHENVLSGSLSSCAAIGLRGCHTWLHAGPMFHLADAWAIWGLMMLGGKQVIVHFEPESSVALITSEHVSHTLLVPTALDMLAQSAASVGSRLGGVESIIYGGAPMPPSIFARARELVDAPLVHTYGITETSGVCTVLHADEHEDSDTGLSRLASIGRETPLIDIDVVDEQGSPRPLGEVGEIRVTSPVVMRGYWGKPTETAAVLSGSSYLTGDLGRRDEAGFLWLTDRKKDMIISGGENVYALEVERVLALHPAVAEVAIIGIPDDRWGERVCAVVAVAPGHELALEDLQQFARRTLAGYKIPRDMREVESLPRTGSGKIDKRAIRETTASRS